MIFFISQKNELYKKSRNIGHENMEEFESIFRLQGFGGTEINYFYLFLGYLLENPDCMRFSESILDDLRGPPLHPLIFERAMPKDDDYFQLVQGRRRVFELRGSDSDNQFTFVISGVSDSGKTTLQKIIKSLLSETSIFTRYDFEQFFNLYREDELPNRNSFKCFMADDHTLDRPQFGQFCMQSPGFIFFDGEIDSDQTRYFPLRHRLVHFRFGTSIPLEYQTRKFGDAVCQNLDPVRDKARHIYKEALAACKHPLLQAFCNEKPESLKFNR